MTATRGATITTLITGSNGFLGQKIGSSLIAAGRQVIGFDATEHTGKDAFPTVIADIRDRDALLRCFVEHGVTSIVHGGGVSGPHVANERPTYLHEVNVGGTLNLFEIAREIELPGRIVFLSSSSTYGQAAEAASITHPCAETQALLASEPYGASKVECEALLRSYVSQFGVDAVALRISIVYGKNRQTYCGITRMITEARTSGTITLDRDNTLPLPWIYVDDLSAAIAAAMAAPRDVLYNQGTYAFNITGPGRPTFAEIAEIVASRIPGTTIGHGNEPDRYAMNARTMSITAAAELLDWHPLIGIESGIAKLLAG